MNERDPLLVNRDRMYADGRNWVPSSDLDAVKAERDDARAAIIALSAHSPFFVTIGTPDIEICQFCTEDGRHAPDCPWLLIEAVAAGKPAFPSPVMLQALREADAALTAVRNAARRATLPDGVLIQVDRAISRCREAGTKLPWPDEVDEAVRQLSAGRKGRAMGWASAGAIFDSVAQGFIDGKVAPEIAKPVLVKLIDTLTEMDWDTVNESRDEFIKYPWIEDIFFETEGDPEVCDDFRPGARMRGGFKTCEWCGWSKRIHELHPKGLNL